MDKENIFKTVDNQVCMACILAFSLAIIRGSFQQYNHQLSQEIINLDLRNIAVLGSFIILLSRKNWIKIYSDRVYNKNLKPF